MRRGEDSMGNSNGFFNTLRLFYRVITHRHTADLLTVTCEHCGSPFVRREESNVENADTRDDDVLVYTAKYVCIKCNAKCECTQRWSRLSVAAVERIKRQIRLSAAELKNRPPADD